MNDPYSAGWYARSAFEKAHREAYARSWLGLPTAAIGVLILVCCLFVVLAVGTGALMSSGFRFLTLCGLALTAAGVFIAKRESDAHKRRIDEFNRQWPLHPEKGVIHL